MAAFRQMMSEAEPRGTRWYHPKMGLFRRLGGRVKNAQILRGDKQPEHYQRLPAAAC